MAKKQEKMTLEKLAMMVNHGFEDVKKELKEEFKKEIDQFKIENAREHEEMKRENAREHEEMKRENSREHDDLKLRQDSSAYRFELVALGERVKKLEKIVVKK